MAYSRDSDDLESLDDLKDFEVGLSEMGDEGSSFRTQNDPSAPMQRTNITERKGAIDCRCIGKDVIHGYLNNGSDAATLLVYDFYFDPRKKARRIQTVDIEFLYTGTGAREPEVLKIAPRGRWTLQPTTQLEKITRGAMVKAGAGMMGVAELGGALGWAKSVSRQTHNATTVVGSIDLKNRNYGQSNAASWTLIENKSMETGVPAHLRTAVLLKRHDFEHFQCAFKIKASVDMKSSLSRMFGSIPKDDPILYNPSLPPTNRLYKFDTDNLDSIDLQSLLPEDFTASLPGVAQSVWPKHHAYLLEDPIEQAVF